MAVDNRSGASLEQVRRPEFAQAFARAVEARLPAAIDLRKRLHQYPCLSGQESEAAELLEKHIPGDMQRVADTGKIGRIGPSSGPAIAIRAELDALPMIEATGAPYASENGAMHACGHDVHQAALVAVSDAAATLDLPYALVPFLQPREEAYPSGALDIVRSGVLKDQNVHVILAAHVHPRLPLGAVATGHGPTNAAADEVRITIQGVGGHGAYPHEARNPITALTHMIVGLNELIRRTVSPMNPVVLTVGKISGGAAANVIPDSAQCAATLRTMVRGDRERVHEAIRQYVRSQGESFGVVAETEIILGEPVLENDSQLVDYVDAQLQEATFAISAPMRSCGADDFSYYSDLLPGVMAFVGVDTEGVESQPSLHSPRFLPDEDSVRRLAHTLMSSYLGACDYLDARDMT